MSETISGKFKLFLAGIPLVLAVGRLVLVSEKGSEAHGYGLIVGPGLMIAWVGPKFKRRQRG